MFKRKTTDDVEEPQEKRGRFTDDEGEISDDETPQQETSSPSSPNKSFLGKLIPSWSWRSPPKVTEKGDNGEENTVSPTSRTSLSPKKASSIITNSKGVVMLEGQLKLKNNWTDDLLDPSTGGYKAMSENVIKQIDDVLQNSNVCKVYMGAVVVKYSNVSSNTRSTRKSPGTIMVHTEMTFHHTYTKLFSDIDELCDNVEDFILLQSSLGEIDNGTIQIADGAESVIVKEKKENTEPIDIDDATPNGHTDVNDDNDHDDFVDAEDSMEEENSNATKNAEATKTAEVMPGTSKPTVENNVQEENQKTTEHMPSTSKPEQNHTQEEMVVTVDNKSPVKSGHVVAEPLKEVEREGDNIVIGKEKIPDVVVTESKEEKDITTATRRSKKSPSKFPASKTTAKPSGSGLQQKKQTKKKSPAKKVESESDHEDISVPSKPGVPVAVARTSNTILLQWDTPRKGSKSVDHYEIKYKDCKKGKGKWASVLSEGPEKTVKVKDLKAESEYEFKVRAVNEDGEEGPFCHPSVRLSTVSSLARSLIPKAKLVEKGSPKVYKLPLIKNIDTVNERAKTRKCVFGTAPDGIANKEKTIMVIGATGSGKTTLVDGMINYITDVSWDDDFRFSLVDLTEDEKKRKASESESQTEWITCYTIHKMEGSMVDYTLNIIDTPGFGDTRGIVRDKRIVDQIREFFTTPGRQGITCLDAVCFVTQAPLGKLTPPQRYIFDQILSVFGQDIASNIFVLVTFADANEPPVRAALKAAKVPYQRSYKFNNSALYASPENPAEAEMGSLFWKMGRDSFKIFFDELRSVESRSLLLTSEVLQLRKRLEASIQGLQHQIAEGMNKLNTIKQEREILKRHKEDIKAKKDFTYEVDEIHMYQIDLEPGVFVTNCMACNRTCHYPCGIPDDHKKENCAAIDQGQCVVCPGHCHWNLHKNNNFRFDTYTMKVTKTYDELKKKYEIAQKEAEKHKSVLGKVKTAFTTLGQDVMKMVHDVRCYINKLNDIALRPNPLSDKDYIDLLIESEKSEKKYGWEQRIKLFSKLREEAELMDKMHQQNYQPWTYIDSDDSDEETTSQEVTEEGQSTENEAVEVDDLPLDKDMEVE